MPQRIAVIFGSALLANIVLAASTCVPAQETKLRTYDDADGYAVLSRMLDEGWSASASAEIVISPVTGKGAELSCAQIPDEFRTTMTDFLLRNREPFRLVERFNTHVNFLLTDNPPSEEPELLPGEQPVVNLPLIRPRVRLSAVGFDKSRTRAFAYMTVLCGPECLSAGYYLLKREKGKWNEVKGDPLCETIAQNREAASAIQGL
jgi:hypothetical protein